MAALWLGNLPALLGLGLLLAGALARMKRHIPLLSAASVLLLGLITLNSRVNVPAFAVASVMAAMPAKPAPALRAPSADDCPCHKKKHAP
jgi:hypothetical protein